ncbi:glycerophosphoryl diester phosphodiesterase family protein, partial [Trifolium medium]|nr:glycerophosphoryl diester phosphodiesterase family protein [Trifolium medium]
LFSDSSQHAYGFALQISVSDVALQCDVQLTKDRFGICFPSHNLQDATAISDVFPNQSTRYLVNGVSTLGYFAIDYTFHDISKVHYASGYLQSHTSLVSEAHKIGLQVFVSDFANDKLSNFNCSHDPLAEYLQFVDNGDFSVDGMLSDFPITAFEAIYNHQHLQTLLYVFLGNKNSRSKYPDKLKIFGQRTIEFIMLHRVYHRKQELVLEQTQWKLRLESKFQVDLSSTAYRTIERHLNKDPAKKGLELMGESKRVVLEDKWRKVQIAEIVVFVNLDS